ncbi:MAG: TonB-dependent receptor, partial [Serratia symbiotica]|nr:TonB-dependent receptor [Serratia symbiotica]
NLVGPHNFDGNNQVQQGTYTTLDTQLGWQATEFMNISVYVDNLLDRRYHTFGYVSGNGALAQANIGRTIGINTRIDFF